MIKKLNVLFLVFCTGYSFVIADALKNDLDELQLKLKGLTQGLGALKTQLIFLKSSIHKVKKDKEPKDISYQQMMKNIEKQVSESRDKIRDDINYYQAGDALEKAFSIVQKYEELSRRYLEDGDVTDEEKIRNLSEMQRLIYRVEQTLNPIIIGSPVARSGIKEDYLQNRSKIIGELLFRLHPPNEMMGIVKDSIDDAADSDQKDDQISWSVKKSTVTNDEISEHLVKLEGSEKLFIKDPITKKRETNGVVWNNIVKWVYDYYEKNVTITRKEDADLLRNYLSVAETEIKSKRAMLEAIASYLSHAQRVIKKNLNDAFSWCPIEILAQNYYDIASLKQIEDDKKRAQDDIASLDKGEWLLIKIAIIEMRELYEKNKWEYQESLQDLASAQEKIIAEAGALTEKEMKIKEDEASKKKKKDVLRIDQLTNEVAEVCLSNEQALVIAKSIEAKLQEIVSYYEKNKMSFYLVSDYILDAIRKVSLFFNDSFIGQKSHVTTLIDSDQALLYEKCGRLRDILFKEEPFSLIFNDPRRIKKNYMCMRRNFMMFMRNILMSSQTDDALFKKNIDFLSGFPRQIVASLWNRAIQNMPEYKKITIPSEIKNENIDTVTLLERAINRSQESIITDDLEDLSEKLTSLLTEEVEVDDTSGGGVLNWVTGYFKTKSYRFKAKKLNVDYFEVIVNATELVWKARYLWPDDPESQKHLKKIRDVLRIIKYDNIPEFPGEEQGAEKNSAN